MQKNRREYVMPTATDLCLRACRRRPACSCRLACATGNSCFPLQCRATVWAPMQRLEAQSCSRSAMPPHGQAPFHNAFLLAFPFTFFSTQTLETEYTVTKRRQNGANSNPIYLAIISSTLYINVNYVHPFLLKARPNTKEFFARHLTSPS